MSTFRRIPEGDELPVSATLYVTYLKCPQQALARLQGVYQAPSVDLFRGSLAHRVFAKHLVEGPIPEGDFELVCRQEAGAHLGNQMASLGMKASDFRAVTAAQVGISSTWVASVAGGHLRQVAQRAY